MADFRNYCAEDFVVNIAGIPFTEGWGPSDMLSIAEIGDGIPESEGIGREVTLSRSRSRRAEIRLTMAQSTPFNVVLNELYEAIKTGGGTTFPIIIYDPNGTTSVTASKAYITKRPDAGFGKSADGTRQWVIRTGQCATFVIGGSSEL